MPPGICVLGRADTSGTYDLEILGTCEGSGICNASLVTLYCIDAGNVKHERRDPKQDHDEEGGEGQDLSRLM
jgi:hypothetical protein